MTPALGRLPDPPDERDHLWRSFVPRGAVEVPASYMVPQDPGPVLDQGDKPHCVGYSAASIRTTQEFLDDGGLRSFDASELYARCKEKDGYPNADGTFIRIALDIAKDRGVQISDGTPTYYAISAYTRLTSVHQIKESLVTDGPVQFGIDLDEAFMSVGPDGIVSAPTGKTVGGHAMAIYGYDDNVAGGSFRVKQTWGAAWGDGGWCWMPYSHFEAYPGWDGWRIADLPNPALPNLCPTCGQVVVS